jgi:hypothetical protein
MAIHLPTILAALVAIPCLSAAQSALCPQFSPQGALSALLNSKLEQRVTVLCNNG